MYVGLSNVESMSTGDLLHLKITISQIIADREASLGEAIVLRKPEPGSGDYIRLVKLVREATGMGLREAKDMVDCGTTIRVSYSEVAAEIKKILGK